MDTSSQTWASGSWVVRAGSEDDFVERWKAWLSWTSQNAPGFRSATLVRSEDDGRHFASFSDWDDADSRAQWQRTDDFRAKMGAVRELCDDVQAGNFEAAASFSRS
jgi:heme-degrading monooxygenase HmoA